MVSWDYDPDAIERPPRYTEAEWANTLGSLENRATLPDEREFLLVGRVVEIGGFEGHTVKETVTARTLQDAIDVARQRQHAKGVRTAGWIAL